MTKELLQINRRDERGQSTVRNESRTADHRSLATGVISSCQRGSLYGSFVDRSDFFPSDCRDTHRDSAGPSRITALRQVARFQILGHLTAGSRDPEGRAETMARFRVGQSVMRLAALPHAAHGPRNKPRDRPNSIRAKLPKYVSLRFVWSSCQPPRNRPARARAASPRRQDESQSSKVSDT